MKMERIGGTARGGPCMAGRGHASAPRREDARPSGRTGVEAGQVR